MNLAEDTIKDESILEEDKLVKSEGPGSAKNIDSIQKSEDKGFKSMTFVPKGVGFIAKNKGLIFSIVIILVSIGLVLLVAKPTYTRYVEGKSVIVAKQQELSELELRVSQLKKIERLVATIERNTELSTQAVPEKDEIPVVMAMVQKISSDSGVKISSFSYAGLTSSAKPQAVVVQTSDPVAENSEFDAFRLNISITGKFDNLKEFLENIESSRRILTISNFSYSLEKSTTEVLGDNYTMKLLLTSYYKDFTPIASEINLDNYSGVVQVLERLNFIPVDLNDTNLGKIDPFANEESEQQNQNNQSDVELNTVETTSGFGQPQSSTGNTTTQDSSTQNVNPTTDNSGDIEAEEGDVKKILQELLLQEGVGN